MEKIRQNIFSIGEVYELQRENQWVEKNRETFREYGYFGGGRNVPNDISQINRIDYSNDTQSALSRGPLPIAKNYLGGTGNSDFGYFGGGNANESRIFRVDYSNDYTDASFRSNISVFPSPVRTALTAVGNQRFGYFVAGQVSTVDRLDYASDTTNPSRRGNELGEFSRMTGSSFGNSDYGWVCGGNIPPGQGFSNPTEKIRRIDYSNDYINFSLRGSFISSKRLFGAVGNSNFGYVGGNYSNISDIDRIDFSNDLAQTLPRGVLSAGRSYLSGTGNSNFGYFHGGTEQVPPYYSLVDRIDYSNDTLTALLRGANPNPQSNHAATSSASFGGSPVSYLGAPWVATAPYGYYGAGTDFGSPRTIYSSVFRIDYQNDTQTPVTRGPLASSAQSMGGTGNSNFGYFIAGINSTIIERIDYSNDSTVSSRVGDSTVSAFSCACGNKNFGYYANSGNVAIRKIDYSNDSIDTVVLGNRLFVVYSATGNSNFGYFIGTHYQRLDYSNDNENLSVRNTLSDNRNAHASTGNENFGYTFGGVDPFSSVKVDRIDYSNDTANTLVRGSLVLGKRLASATGNSNFGYFIGGTPGAASTSVQRLDYTNDTNNAIVRGELIQGRTEGAAVSSQEYGGAPNTPTDPLPTYIRANTVFDDKNTLELPYKRALGSFGYFFGLDKSASDRIDYSNDLLTASVRGSYTNLKRSFGSTGNSNFGYSSGGSIPGPTSLSLTERIDYSNDNAGSLLRGSLPLSTFISSATGNSNFGYFVNQFNVELFKLDYSNDSINLREINSISITRLGLSAIGNSNFGYFGGGSTTVERLDYSNDNGRMSIRGPLSVAKSAPSAGNSNFGYFGCDIDITTVDRIDYSNDTIRASVRGPLRFGRQNTAATGNSNFGYFSGGYRFGNHSTIQRIDYSNDLAQTSIRGPLSFSDRMVLDGLTNARNS